MARKKILFVVEAMGGGVFTYVVDLANRLADRYDMYIAYATREQTPLNYKEYFDPRINLIPVDHFRRAIHPFHDIKAFFQLIRIVNSVEPDIVHLHSSKAGVVGRLALAGSGIPLFYTPHGYSFLMKNHSTGKRILYRGIEMVCARTNCTTISCSYGEHMETLKLTKRAIYIDNGINVKSLQSEINAALSCSEKSSQFTVFSIGRICYQKNPRLFNRIAESLPNLRFLWIGDGELRSELTAENIEITGWVDRSEVLKYALSGDVFVLTSLWEGLPISLLEMMYMKKPCIVSDVIGNHDVIRDGVNGFICNSLEDYVKAIRAVLDSFPHELTQEAYNEICEHYNVKKMSEQYEEAYASVSCERNKRKLYPGKKKYTGVTTMDGVRYH